ncbi:hypothetical protein H4Q26_013917 [Puccinia striiformis f. sp. tritici PST-130]|nr:hypothetical protein H4Q26_013917 [Puccinia striiformis f. sp. tritici PST-130]
MQLLKSLILVAFVLEAAFGTPVGPLTRRIDFSSFPPHLIGEVPNISGVLSPLRRIVEDSKTNIHMAQLRSVISLVEQTRKLKTTTLFKSSREVSVFGVDSVVWIFSKNFTRARDFLSPEPM